MIRLKSNEMVPHATTPTVPETFPTIVVLCGSTRFMDDYVKAQREETLAGRIVISVGMFGHQEGLDMQGETKAKLDELHLRKIDLADEVLVIAPQCQVCPKCKGVWPSKLSHNRAVRILKCGCGEEIDKVPCVPYVGESTKREIDYAYANNVKVRYYWGEKPR